MTRAEIFLRIIGEISGRPLNEVKYMLETFRAINPGGDWTEVLPLRQAQHLLKYMRSEQEAVVRWLERGGLTTGCMVGHA